MAKQKRAPIDRWFHSENYDAHLQTNSPAVEALVEGILKAVDAESSEKQPWFMKALKCDEGCDGQRCIDCKHNPACRRKRQYDRFRKETT